MDGLNRRELLAAISVVVVLCAGCSDTDHVEVYPVKGTVTFNGKPMVGGGSISFIPTTNQRGKTAGGTINPDGTYELMTYDAGDGSMAGDFRVLINQVVYDEPSNNGDSDGSGAVVEPTVTVEEADRIPFKYSDPDNSPLTAKVEAKPLNTIDFTLEPVKKK